MKQNSSTEKSKNRGFTLVELIVVIAILAILAAVAYPVYTGYIKKANEAADQVLLGAVNEAFRSALIDEGVYSGKPDNAMASFAEGSKTIGGVQYLINGTAQDLTEAFMRYFEGNEKSEFKVIEELGYNKLAGCFYGSYTTKEGQKILLGGDNSLTRGKTDVYGNTTWTWEKDGHTYEIVINEAEAEAFNNSFGKNISIGGLMDEVNNVAGSASQVVKSISSGVYDMLGDSLAPYLDKAGIDKTSLEYDRALSNALVLGTASYLSEYSAEELYEAAVSGEFRMKEGSDFILGTAAAMAFKYTTLTGYANSPEGKTNKITDPNTHEEVTIQEYFNNVTANLSAAKSGSEAQAMLNQMNNTIMESAGYKSYMAVNGEDDMAGLLAAMKSINSNSEALAESGVLTSGFGDDSVKDVLGALFS